MYPTFNTRRQRHDGFGFGAVALIICSAMVIGYWMAAG
jgi:hypothetical protein